MPAPCSRMETAIDVPARLFARAAVIVSNMSPFGSGGKKTWTIRPALCACQRPARPADLGSVRRQPRARKRKAGGPCWPRPPELPGFFYGLERMRDAAVEEATQVIISRWVGVGRERRGD